MLTASASGKNYTPIPEGTYAAVCNMLVDLGMQRYENSKYNKLCRKVLIGWQLPEETIEIDGKEEPRTISMRYTPSLDERSNLRADLAAWRGRDFTPEELEAFDLRNIVGAPCLINIIHKEINGRNYANISSIMALPRGMQKPQMVGEPTVFDLDESSLSEIAKLPKWIAETIYKSETYQERVKTGVDPEIKALDDDDDGKLPF